jgi:hypothetical protein
MTTRFEEIDGKMKRAVAVRADQVLGKFANFMRENMLRVSDLIAKVDTSCDGVVDIEEMAAAIKMVHLDLSDEEVRGRRASARERGERTRAKRAQEKRL